MRYCISWMRIPMFCKSGIGLPKENYDLLQLLSIKDMLNHSENIDCNR
jgi:hypothetical protein